jgi:protein-L-isoaspartate(D-aspartate) O-methyltransferase
MIDFAAARRMMVDGQVRTADVTDLRLIEAMQSIPRERFVPEDKAALAYLDLDLPLGDAGRTPRRMLKPMVLAKLIQMADIGETDRVLDVGCGGGYSAALLARLAALVVALEEDASLTRRCGEALAAANVANAKVLCGPLALGWPAEGPYDAIIMEGATEVAPDTLLRQLKNGGRLACIVGAGPAAKATLYRSVDGDFSSRPVFDATAALLPGFAKQPEFVF